MTVLKTTSQATENPVCYPLKSGRYFFQVIKTRIMMDMDGL